MKINKRTVNFYEVQLHTISLSNDIPVPNQTPMSDVLPFLARHIPASFEIPCGSTPIEVTASRWDDAANELHLLLNIVDPERSDVAYRRRRTKTRRLGNKATDEDIEVSSHVVLRPLDGSPTAQMAMTTGAGIYPSKVVSLLKSIYRAQSKSAHIKRLTNPPIPTGTEDSKGKPKTFKVRHQFNFHGMPNGTLNEIIRTGKIVGIELIDTDIQSLDSSGNVSIDKMQMHVSVTSASVDIPFIRRLMQVSVRRRNINADKIRIEYIDSRADTNQKPKSQTFRPNQLEEAFTRSETIELDTAHHDHQTHISDEIITKMSALL